jgi:chitinase
VTLASPGLAPAVTDTSVRRFVLAFLSAQGSSCTPEWGNRALNDPVLLAGIAAVRTVGGAVTVGSGGASGDFLETTCASADALAAAYEQALAVSGGNRLDVDIETRVQAEQVARALATVHRDTGVPITVTLGVGSAATGLTADGLAILRALAAHGAAVTVNAMLMNFPPDGNWRHALLTAAETVTTQIAGIWPDGGRSGAYRRLGLTVMAGRNDTGVITTLADARAVGEYAAQHGIAFLGLWSLARDNGDCPGRTAASPDCSGVAQQPYQFIQVLTRASS